MVQKNIKSGSNEISPKGGFLKFIQFIYGFILFIFWLGGFLLIWFVINRSFYGFQEFVYGRSGEIIIGSNVGMIPALLLALSINYFFNMLVFKKLKKYFFHSRILIDDNKKNYSVPFRLLNSVNNFVIGLMCVSLFFMFVCFHAYIALGEKYIAASSAFFFNNRIEYRYADIRFSKQIQRNGATQSEVYLYEFPDGKSISDLGGEHMFGGNLAVIKQIQEKQRLLGFNVSEIALWQPKNKQGDSFFTILSYFNIGISILFYTMDDE